MLNGRESLLRDPPTQLIISACRGGGLGTGPRGGQLCWGEGAHREPNSAPWQQQGPAGKPVLRNLCWEETFPGKCLPKGGHP